MLPTYPLETRTLLYVEDDRDARDLFEMAKHAAGAQFHLRFAESVAEAMAYLSGEGAFADRDRFPIPEGVLLDFNLGKASGADLLCWMRQTEFTHMEVAVFSTSDSPSQISHSYHSGADYCLIKPSDFGRLTEVVRAIERGFNSTCGQRLFRLVTLPEFRSSVHDVIMGIQPRTRPPRTRF